MASVLLDSSIPSIVTFHEAEIGPNEKFGRLEQPFSEVAFSEKGVGGEETADDDTTEVFALILQSFLSPPNLISVSFFLEQTIN